MKVAILGAGAMGALVGSCFHKGGAEVWLVDPFEAHMKKIAEEGLAIFTKPEFELYVCIPKGERRG